jgi:hypothetical protein
MQTLLIISLLIVLVIIFLDYSSNNQWSNMVVDLEPQPILSQSTIDRIFLGIQHFGLVASECNVTVLDGSGSVIESVDFGADYSNVVSLNARK